jgi:8-oxo-dGTP diphosphatase
LELWDLLDGDRKPLCRTHRRGRELNPGEYHVVVEIWTVNRRGELLVTLRDPQKETWPGKWENTGGSAVAGETSLQAAVRELREETGIAASENELTPLGVSRAEGAFHDLYALCRDVHLRSLTLQPGETVDARWVTPVQLEAMIVEGSLAPPVGERYGEVKDSLLAFLRRQAE